MLGFPRSLNIDNVDDEVENVEGDDVGPIIINSDQLNTTDCWITHMMCTHRNTINIKKEKKKYEIFNLF